MPGEGWGEGVQAAIPSATCYGQLWDNSGLRTN